MSYRKQNKRSNEIGKMSSEQPNRRQDTAQNLQDSRSHFVHSHSKVKSEPGDAVRTAEVPGPQTCLSSDVLSTKQRDSRNVLGLNQDLVIHKREYKRKVQHEKDSTQVKTTSETNADHRTLLNVIVSGAHYQAIELLKDDHTFSQEELDDALIAACQHGHKYLIQKLVDFGANVRYKDKNGNTALLISVRNGFIDIVRFLIMKKADVNVSDFRGNTALILSIRSSGSKDMVKVLLAKEGININHKNQEGYTCLMKAVEAMDIDTVKILLDKYAKQKFKKGDKFFCNQTNWNKIEKSFNTKGENAQQLAEKYGLKTIWKLFTSQRDRNLALKSAFNTCDTELFNILLYSQFLDVDEMKRLVERTFSEIVGSYVTKDVKVINDKEIAMIMKLLEYGAEVNISFHNDISRLLCVAIKVGKFNLIELICKHLEQQKQLQRQRAEIQTLALTKAAEIGRCDLIELLLRYNTDIKPPRFSNSPLDCALSKGHIDCAKLLIQHGAQIDIKHALESAVEQQMVKYMEFLVENYKQDIAIFLTTHAYHLNKLLISAASKGNLDIIGHILDVGADVNGSNFSGQTPLVESKDADVAVFLIKRGANVNHVSPSGNTPLVSVMVNSFRFHNFSKIEVVQVLIKNGACVNTRNCDGETPLMLAASLEKFEPILQTLLDCGANIHDQDNKGDTALMQAACYDCSQNVSILLESAKNKNDFINIQNHEGFSALMYAVSLAKLTTVQKLLDHGADVNIKDVNGNIALSHAVTKFTEGMEEVMTALIRAGSQVDCQNNDGLSPLMLAVKVCLKHPLTILLDSGADVNAVSKKDNTNTAISLLTHSTCLSRSKVFCTETLLERGANSSYVNPDFLHQMIIHREISVIIKLIRCGLAPSDVNPHRMLIRGIGNISSVSPLCAALLVGNVSLARYFFGNLFLTNSDISSLTCNKDIHRILEGKKQQESVNFLNEISSQPLSLFQLSFVTVSSAVGPSPGREHRVNMLPLPQVMKDKLLFQSEVITLNIPSESNEPSHFSEMDLRIDPHRFFIDYDVGSYDDSDYDIYSDNLVDSDNYYDYDTDY